MCFLTFIRVSLTNCDAQILAVLYEDLQGPCVKGVLFYLFLACAIGNAVRMFSL